MTNYDEYLNEKLKNPKFKKGFDEYRRIFELSIKIIEARKKAGLTQNELASKAGISQQLLSKIENGENCNLTTFIKVCNALNINFLLKSIENKNAKPRTAVA